MASIRISIVTYNNVETIERCIKSVLNANTDHKLSVTVVDNASNDDTAKLVEQAFPQVTLIKSKKNLGFGAGHNLVLKDLAEDYVLILNPDAWLLPGAINHLVETAAKAGEPAITGPVLEYEEGWPQLSYGEFPCPFNDLVQKRYTEKIQRRDMKAVARLRATLKKPHFDPEWISGACMLISRNTIESTGLFDERFFLYMEDVDLCKRVRRNGGTIKISSSAVCRHLEGHSVSDSSALKKYYRTSRLQYFNKYGQKPFFFIYKILRARSIDLKYDEANVAKS